MTLASIGGKISLILVGAALLAAGTSAAAANDIEQHFFRIPGTDYHVTLGASAPRPHDVLTQPLLVAINRQGTSTGRDRSCRLIVRVLTERALWH